jgi:hypothetical protein
MRGEQKMPCWLCGLGEMRWCFGGGYFCWPLWLLVRQLLLHEGHQHQGRMGGKENALTELCVCLVDFALLLHQSSFLCTQQFVDLVRSE